jgi:hypothetical protein
MLQSEAISTSPWSLQNSASVSANSTTSPDGATTADTLGGTSSSSYTEQAIPWTASGNWTLSLFAKAGTSTRSYFYIVRSNSQIHGVSINWSGGVPTVNSAFGGSASIQALSSGWYRIVFQLTSVDHTVTNYLRLTSDIVSGTGTVILWGLQAEQGSFPTSYIPTTTATVTRAADVASMTGTNFSSWYNQSAGSFFVNANHKGSSHFNNAIFLKVNNGTTNNQIKIFSVGADPYLYITYIAAEQAYIDAGSVSVGLPNKYAAGFTVNNFALSVNGATAVTDASGTSPMDMTQLTIGARLSGVGQPNGTIARLTYYPVRLPGATLQALTAT